MLLSGIASLATVARETDVSVLLTRTTEYPFSEPIRTAADQHRTCEQTPFGPRSQTPDDETLVYPVEGGQWVQTTLSFWADILAALETEVSAYRRALRASELLKIEKEPTETKPIEHNLRNLG